MAYKRQAVYKRHNISEKDFFTMLIRQDWSCAICDEPHTDDDPLYVDHDHSCCPSTRGSKVESCGKCVRGLLCNRCNLGLGMFQEDGLLFYKAFTYLSQDPDHALARWAKTLDELRQVLHEQLAKANELVFELEERLTGP